MAEKNYSLTIKVYLEDMLSYFSNYPQLGTLEKPYPVDAFYKQLSSDTQFTGPLKNILIFEKGCSYNWTMESSDGTPINILSSPNNSVLEFEMIDEEATDKKWKQIFSDAPEMNSQTGKIQFISCKEKEAVFNVETSSDFEGSSIPLKYSFTFEFEDKEGAIKYGTIDPFGKYPPPPPED